MHVNRGTQKPTHRPITIFHHHNSKMNNHRKQSTPLFPTTINIETQSSSSIFNSFSSSLLMSSLPPTPRFELPTPPHPPLKSEPTDFLPPLPGITTTLFRQHLLSSAPSSSSSSLKRQRTITNAVVRPTSTLARQRRTRLSDKTRCLQKLIPLDRQMDTATLYDQTYKYVKFLETQITLLQSMPLQVIPAPPTSTTHRIHQMNRNDDRILYDGIEELSRLNRQQVLQVLMSSEVAQTVMYTTGWCVFSAEQLAALWNDREHQGVVFEQHLI